MPSKKINYKKRINIINSVLYPEIIAICVLLLCGCGIDIQKADEITQTVPERHIENLGDLSVYDMPDEQEQLDLNMTQDTTVFEDEAVDEVKYDEKDDSAETAPGDTLDEENSPKEEAAPISLTKQELRIYSEEEISKAAADNVGRFAYESLSADEKLIYNQIYLSLTDMTDGASLGTLNIDLINKLFQCVMVDHPEIYWVSGYTYTSYTCEDILEAIGFRGNYIYSKDEQAVRNVQIDNYVGKCLAGLPGLDDYSKIKYIYEYIIKNTEYDLSASDNQNICSVFIGGRSVCQGYAKATQYLLGKAGIRCSLVTGITTNNQNHAWNMVYADGAYYYVDTTWGDASYRIDNSTNGNTPPITYDYLCVSTQELQKTHTPNSVFALPLCGSMADNYYVREGAYFDQIDSDRLSALFSTKQADGSEFVSIKCSSSALYSEMKDYLLNKQYVFDYLNIKSGTVSYWETAEMNTITFRLKE